MAWDGETLGAWIAELDTTDVVINLAGQSVDCRYTASRRREIMSSRIDSTHIVGEAISRARHPPATWLQASTATIYAHRYDTANDETHGIIGGGEPGAPDRWRFSIDVATAWERALNEANTPYTRRVAMRSAIVLSPDRGGAFDVLLRLVRNGLGGPAGDGRQFVSWVHGADFVRAVRWLIDHTEVSGVVNIASPNPLPNAEFMQVLREVWGTDKARALPAWLLELGALMIRTETELVLKSRRVIPARLLDHGFSFTWPDWPDAARDLVTAWRVERA
jgi:uncharacterized protein (TIGR01777 family)